MDIEHDKILWPDGLEVQVYDLSVVTPELAERLREREAQWLKNMEQDEVVAD